MKAVARIRQLHLVVAVVALVVAAVLAIAACGGASEPSGPTPGAAATGSPRSSPVPTTVTPTPGTETPAPSPPPSESPAQVMPTATPTSSRDCPADNAVRSWYYVPNDAHLVPQVPADVKRLLRAYRGLYVAKPGDKVVYLTFDEGYENGFTGRILDRLRAAGVTAAFFVTGDYVRENPELVRRMVAEGHVVANHTDRHPSLPSLAGDTAAFSRELTATEKAFRRATGGELARLLRPPMGEYSARSLRLSRKRGYTTVFWSFAHRDWLVDDQPPVSTTVRRVLAGSHDGAVYLLHAVSRSNTEALPAVVVGLREQGYRIGSPTELVEKTGE